MDPSHLRGAGAGAHYSSLPEVSLPAEIASVLPSDPYLQLELAHKIACYTYQRQVAQVEAESQQLRDALGQKQQSIKALERRLSNMELELQELQDKYKQSSEEQHKLAAEKAALIDTVKRLNRDVARLEHFKRNLLQTLQEDEEGPSSTGRDAGMTAVDMSTERMVADVLHNVGAGGTMPAYQQQQLEPVGLAHRGVGSAGPGPLSNGRSSTYQTPARSPPPRLSPGSRVPAASPKVDGKEFFRQARARLSYEQFSKFLQSIKELNANRQTREETLRRAKEIFGVANGDLYGLFEGLLSRHITSL